jgi:hypothetical protein
MTLQAAQTADSQMRERRLAPYMPGRSELKEFASRLRNSLSYRGADKLTDHELLALAAASRAHGLNPYMGEIWAIPGKGLMIGRAGWVKKINEKLDNRGIRWWSQYQDIRPNEYAAYGIPADARLAYVCELRRADQIDAYLSALERMSKLGIQGEDAMALIGRPPVIRGIGYIGAKEVEPGQPTGAAYKDKEPAKQGYMSFGERCKKRAFAQACKEIVDLPFNVLTDGDIIDGLAIDAGEYVPEVMPDDVLDESGSPGQAENAADNAALPADSARLCELDGAALYAIQRDGPGLIAPDFHPRHFEKRWQKRFGVRSLQEIEQTFAEFMEIMREPSSEEAEAA